MPVIFTTQVHFLDTLFDGSCQSTRRLQALADSIIIFDEIQTLPVKCTYIFNLAMNFLKEFTGVTAVLCTATQPQLHRTNLPIHIDGEIVPSSDLVFQAFQRVSFEYLKDMLYTAESLGPLLLQDAVKRGNVLCIVNLTRQARDLYKAVEKLVAKSGDDVEIIHLSTKMCPAHRVHEIDRMKDVLSAFHSGTSKRKLICISTQLMEAGVDMSFATVYRALAGIDSLAQAAGRCNRHGELEEGLVRVFRMEDENLDKLPDIQIGVQVAKDLLHIVDIQDILQPVNLALYFKRYYAAQTERNKSYELPSRNTLLDLLSANDAGRQACGARERIDARKFLYDMQAFGDAGNALSVIDSATMGILVPYEDGGRLIAALNDSVEDPEELLALFRKAQQYMVNVFSYELEQLQRMGAVHQIRQGPLTLRKDYYNLDIGINFET